MLVTLVTLWPMLGCEKSPYHRLEGTVTFKGKPVPLGEVQLMPDSTKGNSGPSTVALIKDGRYETREQRGVIGGAYVIMVKGYAKPVASNDPTAADFGPQLFDNRLQYVDLPASDHVYDIHLD